MIGSLVLAWEETIRSRNHSLRRSEMRGFSNRANRVFRGRDGAAASGFSEGRKMGRMLRITLLLAAMTFPTRGARAAIVYAPPEASVDAANELEGIGRELGDRNYASAAKRLDALLAAKADQLV